MNAHKEKVRQRIKAFTDGVLAAADQLKKDQSRKSITASIEALSLIRNQEPGKTSQGLILLDQFFTVPQIGEVIRDLLILDRLANSIER